MAPYQLCANGACKMAFRRARAIYEVYTDDPTRYNWDWNSCGGVPPGLCTAAERAQKQRLRDKRRRAKANKKEKHQVTEMQTSAAEAAARNDSIVLEMEKRKAVAQAGSCCMCTVSMFENPLVIDIFGQKCCSARCVLSLRRQQAANAAERRLAK